jgi:hypothetical protein
MNNYENAVFVSYAWGGESEATVDSIELAFADRGISIIRDKKILQYRDSIAEFEKRIGKGQCVILVISDKYLRSSHCMYELVLVYENQKLRQRIFPIVLDDARIYNGTEREQYYEYWEEKYENLNESIRNARNVTYRRSSIDELEKLAIINKHLDTLLTEYLSDMNALTPEIHATSGFSTLVHAIEQVVKPPAPPPPVVERYADGPADMGIEVSHSKQLSDKERLIIDIVEDLKHDESSQEQFEEYLSEEIKKRASKKGLNV